MIAHGKKFDIVQNGSYLSVQRAIRRTSVDSIKVANLPLLGKLLMKIPDPSAIEVFFLTIHGRVIY